MNASVLILTFNEEKNVLACIESVAWSDDIIVFDSFSTDRTAEVARAAGARVVQHAFANYGAQREAARTLARFRNPWVLVLDADERPDAQLVREIHAIAHQDEPYFSAYRIRRKDYFMGTWIRHSSLYPSWFVRFIRHEKVFYEPREVHEYPTVNGSTEALQGHLLHDSFSKGFSAWWAKHLRYAKLEAQAQISSTAREPIDFLGWFQVADPVRRRRALKQLSFHVPFRPCLRFVYMYVIRGGVFDGSAGFRYCSLLAAYERQVVREVNEIRRISRAEK